MSREASTPKDGHVRTWPRRARARTGTVCVLIAIVATSVACGRILKKEYEYEEELYLALDGSATINLNASVPSLVALRGLDLPVDPRARVDRERIRSYFEVAGANVTLSLSRRDGRRFVHVSVTVDDINTLQRVAPFAWSTYQFARDGDVYEYHQLVGRPAGAAVGDVGWTGKEIVAFRMHVPSKIPFHNAPSRRVERGNILEWEQPLSERLGGSAVDIRVQMENQSILTQTLLLFGSTIVAAALTFGVVIWWVARRGRAPEMAELQS